MTAYSTQAEPPRHTRPRPHRAPKPPTECVTTGEAKDIAPVGQPSFPKLPGDRATTQRFEVPPPGACPANQCFRSREFALLAEPSKAGIDRCAISPAYRVQAYAGDPPREETQHTTGSCAPCSTGAELHLIADRFRALVGFGIGDHKSQNNCQLEKILP
jgi:hypothetical protein